MFNAAIDAACKNLSSAACQGMWQELSAMAKSYDEQMDGQYIGTMRSVYGDGAKQVDGLMWQYATADMKAQREADIVRLMDKGVSRKVAEGLSFGMRTVHDLAAMGGAVYGMKGAGVAGESAGTIRNVNPGYPVSGRTHNCVNCSIATDATLAGNPASALPIYSNIQLKVFLCQYWKSITVRSLNTYLLRRISFSK
ncbi:DUF6862 domain-containing protein [Pectobacterium brasiliense]|uniref:DUF6862 domain-containing protein n=1 Tax=Pectobacterium brasiliense TaxID=180957 RepID=UPI002D1E37B4|nr:hypothetical protein [Pectobacterium brasiliense]